METYTALEQFRKLNEQILHAIAGGDMERVVRLDLARRQILGSISADELEDTDDSLFELLENCASDNARAISGLETELRHFGNQAHHRMRQLQGYCRQT